MTPTDTVSFFGHCHLINCAHLFFPSAPLLIEHLACVQTAEIVGCKCISAVISSLLSLYLLPYKQNDLHERLSGGADKHITELLQMKERLLLGAQPFLWRQSN